MLAVCSGGGHWVEMLRLAPAFAGCDLAYVTVNEAYRSQARGARFHVINDATRWDKVGLIEMSARLAAIIALERPDVIISTGAACGYIALRLGKLARAKTIWVDSMANVDELSLSGAKIGRHADLWLTQWPHLARPNGPYYAGAVL